MSALGSVFIRASALDDLADLAVDDFFLPAHREILDAMRAVAARDRAVDIIAVADELKVRGMIARLDGGQSYLNDLANIVPTAENVRHYAKIVADKATLRRMLALCAHTMSRVYGGDGDVEEVLNDLRAGAGEIELAGSGGPQRVGDRVHAVLDDMEKRGNAPQEYLVPTGLERFDHKIGGLRAGHLVVIAANPGRGKTALAWNIAVRAGLVGIPVLVFSLEMSEEELIERAISYKARINGRAVHLGRLNSDQWYAAGNAAFELDRFPMTDSRGDPHPLADKPVRIYVDDRKHKTARLIAEARRWRARHPDPRALIVIDYLGLVEPDVDERTREREVAKMSRAFKVLAHKTRANAPVVLCAQLNRDNVGKDGKMRPPVLRDLRDSGAIEADADMVIFPWWEGNPPEVGEHPAELIVEKHRGGAKGPVRTVWQPQFTTFVDPPDTDEPEQLELGTAVDRA